MKLRNILAILLTLTILFCASLISTNAAIPPQKIGDVNGDRVVDILDATAIQLHLAKIEFIFEGFYGRTQAADVDSDSAITIVDASTIQLYVASIITEFPAGEEYYVDKFLYDVHADYDSGKAMAGVPVTFYAHGSCKPSPTTVKLYINEELVAQTQERTNLYDYTLRYTFESAGIYQVRIFMCDKWGYGISRSFDDFVVVDTPEDTSKPIITSIHRNNSSHIEPEITAVAQFGTAPYQYKFTLAIYNGLEIIHTQDFSENDKFQVDFGDMFPAPHSYTITVEVKDSVGNTVIETREFTTEMLVPA